MSFFDATSIFHTVNMTQPSQYALSEQRVHDEKASIREGISVGHFVLSGCSHDTTDDSQVVVV